MESFGAYGQRRGTNWTGSPTSGELATINDTTRNGFTEHEMLDSTELVHMNGRVFDPVIGRFVSADPIEDCGLGTQGWNRYAYVGNRVATLKDPTGFYSEWDSGFELLTVGSFHLGMGGIGLGDCPEPTPDQVSVCGRRQREGESTDWQLELMGGNLDDEFMRSMERRMLYDGYELEDRVREISDCVERCLEGRRERSSSLAKVAAASLMAAVGAGTRAAAAIETAFAGLLAAMSSHAHSVSEQGGTQTDAFLAVVGYLGSTNRVVTPSAIFSAAAGGLASNVTEETAEGTIVGSALGAMPSALQDIATSRAGRPLSAAEQRGLSSLGRALTNGTIEVALTAWLEEENRAMCDAEYQ
jgi:RHS repeat-associated protein